MLTSNPLVESWAHFPAAKRRLLRLLQDTNPANLLLLSGDVHYAELSGAIPCLRPILLHVLCVLSATPRAVGRLPAQTRDPSVCGNNVNTPSAATKSESVPRVAFACRCDIVCVNCSVVAS